MTPFPTSLRNVRGQGRPLKSARRPIYVVAPALVALVLAMAPGQYVSTASAISDDLAVSLIVEGPAPADAGQSVIRRRVAVKVTSRSGRQGHAVLRASLQGPPVRGTVCVDGIVLSAATRLIDTAVPIGPAVHHIVEVDLPGRQRMRGLPAAIVWDVLWEAAAR